MSSSFFVLAISVAAPAADDLESAKKFNRQAVAHVEAGRDSEAEPLYRQSLEIAEKILGPEHPEIATMLSALSETYFRREHFRHAEQLCLRALQIRRKTLAPDHADLGRSLSNLAEIHRSTGRYGSAETLYRQAIEILEKGLGPTDPAVGVVVNNLATLHAGLGHFDSAVQLYERALAIVERSEDADSRTLTSILNNLALCYVERKMHRAAEPLLLRALRNERSIAALENYAIVLRKTKRGRQANEIEREIRGLRSGQ